MERYHDGSWNQLETEEIGQTDSGREFEAVTEGFSYFAVSGDQEQETEEPAGDQEDEIQDSNNETVQDSNNQTDQDSNDSNETSGSGLFKTVAAIVILLSVVGILMIGFVKREDILEKLEEFSSEEEEDESPEFV